ILQGPRRAGKSTLLQAKFPDYKYVTLDDLDDLALAKKDPKMFIEKLGTHFIIDEAQRIPELSLPIKKLIDQNKQNKTHAILTGSTGIRLKEQLYDTLAGRIEFLRLPTCCFGENFGLPTHKIDQPLDHDLEVQAKREFQSFFTFGGFPEVLNNLPEEEKEKILKLYKNSYFTRDLASLLNLDNVEGIKAMFGALIKGLGSRYEMSSLSKETGLSIPTAKKYFNSLLLSGLSFKLYGYHLGPAKRYIAKSKNYFLDQGILFALSDEFSKGQAFENFIVSEIEKRRQLGFINADELYYYESAGGSEIDIVIEEKQSLTLIEIKSSKKLSLKELKNIKTYNLKTNKKIKKMVFYLGDDFYWEENILIIPAWNFFRASF
ncbi:MAG: hypothetical protein A2328_11260, partial [Bdellovibrionales bacterium RIFOXYB2_FULL_36_6]